MVQRRAIWPSVLVFAVSAAAATGAVRHAWEATRARDARWVTQVAADVPQRLAERVRCLDASVDALRGALASSTTITPEEWRTYVGTTTPAGTCHGVLGVAYIGANPPRVVHRSGESPGPGLADAAWMRLFAAMHPDDRRIEAGPVFGPTVRVGAGSLALYIAAVPGPAPASPLRGWAALLVSPSELFVGLIDAAVIGVRVEDVDAPGPPVLDTVAAGRPIVLSSEIGIGERPLRLSLADARPANTGIPTTVGVVALLGALQVVTLTWLVYTLAASRERYALRAAMSDASLKREAAETRKLSLVARHATDLVLITDRIGRIEWANAAFLQASGYTTADVERRHAWALLHGPDTPAAAAEAVTAALGAGQGCRVDTVHYGATGVPSEVSVEVQPVRDDDGQLSNFIVIARDVTAERRAQRALSRSEQQYRRVVEQVEQVIFQLDAEGRWTFLNRAWHSLTGYPVDAAIGQSMGACLHPDDRQEAQTLCAELLACRKDECKHDLRFVTSTGDTWWGAVHARLLVEQGELIGIAGTITDVSGRRRVQQELERARVAAEKASEAKSEFLKAMSHDMRTPLNGVLGLMELLAATGLDAQQSRYVAVARASATHLSTLISDILDLSRLDAGALGLAHVTFDLPDLVESALDVVAAEASTKRLRLSCTVTQDVPTWVRGDPGRLRQVLVNLLANAVHFTEQGEVHVEVRADVDVQARTALVRIEVHDTGIGLAPDAVDCLFLPLAPGEASASPRQGGSGLGLTICRRLLDTMGGSIAVRSVEHEGTTFSVDVPLDVADTALADNQSSHEVPLRILAVLPDPADRAAVGLLLEGWRLDSVVVSDCAGARELLAVPAAARSRFAVVVLDGLTPGAAAFARLLPGTSPAPGVVWITPEDGHLPGDVSGVREQVARPLKGPPLFDAIMQAAVTGASRPAATFRLPEWPRRLRVLVAEDHDVNQMVVREMLQAMGCDVDVVADGDAAVVSGLATAYDIVLMDCQMPGVDGLEATRRLRRAHADGRTSQAPRIIALTAFATPEDRQACFDAGMDAYLTKPLRGPVLQRTLQRLMSGDVTFGAQSGDAPPVPVPWFRAARAHSGALGGAPDVQDILDPVEVLRRCNNNGDLGARMLHLFAESLPADLEAIERAAVGGDTEAVGRIVHKMRGAAATLAATRLAGALTGIELFLKYGDGGPLADLIGDVHHESALLLGAVPADRACPHRPRALQRGPVLTRLSG